MNPTPEQVAAALKYCGDNFNADDMTTEDWTALQLLREHDEDHLWGASARILRDEARRLSRDHLAARTLLHRWHEWARAHGHDTGILDDTRGFLFNNVSKTP